MSELDTFLPSKRFDCNIALFSLRSTRSKVKGHIEIYLAYAKSNESEDEADEASGESSRSHHSENDWEIITNNAQTLENPPSTVEPSQHSTVQVLTAASALQDEEIN